MVNEADILEAEDVYDLVLISALKRASQGLPLKPDDIMAWMVNSKDDRERTRLAERVVYHHAGGENLADIYPRTFGFLASWNRIENIYFISLDGLQRQEAILMTKAKTAATTPLTIENITNPTVQPGQPQAPQQAVPQPQPKKGWLRR